MGFALLQADSRAGCLDLSGPPESPCPSSVSHWRPAVAHTPIHASLYIQTALSRPQWAFRTPAGLCSQRNMGPSTCGDLSSSALSFLTCTTLPAGTPFKLRAQNLPWSAHPGTGSTAKPQLAIGPPRSASEAASRLLPEASTVSAKAALCPRPSETSVFYSLSGTSCAGSPGQGMKGRAAVC